MAFKALGNTLLGNTTPEKELLQNDCEARLCNVSPPAQGWDWLAAPGFNYSISIYFLLRPGETQETDSHSNLFLKYGSSSYQKAFV